MMPLFDRWQAVTGVSKKILWGNLGAGIYSFYKFLGETLDSAAAHHEDGPALLDMVENELDRARPEPALPAGVAAAIRRDSNTPEPIQLRTTCCLWYKVPAVEKCGTCPWSEGSSEPNDSNCKRPRDRGAIARELAKPKKVGAIVIPSVVEESSPKGSLWAAPLAKALKLI